MFEFQAEVYIGLNVEMIEGREGGVLRRDLTCSTEDVTPVDWFPTESWTEDLTIEIYNSNFECQSLSLSDSRRNILWSIGLQLNPK